jgi:hypothetical protein
MTRKKSGTSMPWLASTARSTRTYYRSGGRWHYVTGQMISIDGGMSAHVMPDTGD